MTAKQIRRLPKRLLLYTILVCCLTVPAWGQDWPPAFFYPTNGAYVNAVGDSLIYYERTDGSDSIIVVFSQNGIYFRVHVADSALMTIQAVKLEIEDSLDEYSLTTDIAANYQPLESILTDIADGIIDYNLDNQQQPWAANEIVSTVIHNDEIDASSELLAIMDDETGTGVLVFGTSPTFTTDIESPLLIGGTETTSDLTLKTTSGVGASGADMHFLVGNNGATEAMTILNNGNVGVGTNTPDASFHIKADLPGTVGSHPAGQFIIQNPTNSVVSNVVISAYESDAAGDPDQQLWYLGSSSGSNSDITFLNRRFSSLHLGTNGTTRLTIDEDGNIAVTGTVDGKDVSTLTDIGQTVESGEIANGTIKPIDLNQSSKFNFNAGAFHVDSTAADSEYVSKKTSETYANSILTGALIENPRIIGGLELTENIYQWNRTTDFDTSVTWANNADTFQRWSLPIGSVSSGLEDSSYCAHLDVLGIPLRWNKWYRLMGMTPMFSDAAGADEEPYLMASNNGDYWVPFIGIDSVTYDSIRTFWDDDTEYADTGSCLGACDSTHDYIPDTWAYQPEGDYDSSKLAIIWGDTVNCPIINWGDFKDTIKLGGDTSYASDYLSDSDIRLWTNDTLYYFFRMSYRDTAGAHPGNKAFSIWVMRSGDGVTWVDTTRLFTRVWDEGAQRPLIMSPTVFVDSNNIMTMYLVTDTNTAGWSVSAGGQLIVERRWTTDPLDTLQWQTNVDTCDWTSPWNRTEEGKPPGMEATHGLSVWHIDCQRVGDEIHCFEVMCQHGQSGDGSHLFFTKSKDGLHFRTPSKPILVPEKNSGHWDDNLIYRGSGFPVDWGASRGYDLWYPSLGLASTGPSVNRWRIGRTRVHFESRWKYAEFDQVYEVKHDDSVTLTFERFDTTTNQFYWFSDSTNKGNDTGAIGMSGTVSNFPFASDTLIYWYKASGDSCYIDSIEVFVCRDTINVLFNYESYTVFPDSSAMTSPTNHGGSSLARVVVPFSYDFGSGERVGMVFHTKLITDEGWVRVYNAHLKGTEIGKNR